MRLTRPALVAALVSWMMALGVCLGGSITLESLTGYIYMPAGDDLVPAASNWVIAVYGVGGNGIVDGFGAGDDTLIGTLSSPWGDDGYLYANLSSTGGVTIFTRVYNSSDFVNDSNPGSATEYVNLGFDPWATPSTFYAVPKPDDEPAASWYFNTGASNPDGSDWQPVPEPGTLALVGVGFMAVVMRRRLAKKNA